MGDTADMSERSKDDLIGLLREDRATLQTKVNKLEARLMKLYTDCPLTPTRALKLNPDMLGSDDEKCWMQADKVFAITHPKERL